MTTVFAFPRSLPEGKFVPDEAIRILQDHAGMTLRDYFAAAALPALINESYNRPIFADDPIFDVARAAYELADAMLAERAR